MKILLTGSTGYIGKRLLPHFLAEGHEVVCLVRDTRRFPDSYAKEKNVTVINGDLLNKESLQKLPKDIDIAYYLVHSMGSTNKDFMDLEAKGAENFVTQINNTNTKQIIYLSGIINDENTLSKH